jgi:hypothetical protein
LARDLKNILPGGEELMSEKREYSEAKRALLDRYLRGHVPQEPASAVTARTRGRSVPTEPLEGVAAVQTGGSRRPFFLLHGQWKDGGFYCFRLARELEPDQPFYAVEPYDLIDAALPHSFQAIAADHVKSIRAIQPEGPFLFGRLAQRWCARL